jgi:tellurite resistance protein TerC
MPGAKSIAVRVAGLILLAVGLAMMVLPGPALIIIPAALALLASEFPWAQRALARFTMWRRRARASTAQPMRPPPAGERRRPR